MPGWTRPGRQTGDAPLPSTFPLPCLIHRTVQSPRLHRFLRLIVALVTVTLLLGQFFQPARAVELVRLEAQRSEQGVLLSFETRFELPASVEDALQRGVALYFSAEAQLMRSRWYWRDKELGRATRIWRIAYQPLTFSYKVSQGGLSQTYRTLGEAMRAVQRIHQWRIADPVPDDDRHYVEFSYRLDTDLLPRPLQIGVGNQPEWTLRTARTVPLAD